MRFVQAVSTNIASDGMEAARRACGGHGYSLLSGLPTTFTHYVQNVTWEGDNNVMLLQAKPSTLTWPAVFTPYNGACWPTCICPLHCIDTLDAMLSLGYNGSAPLH